MNKALIVVDAQKDFVTGSLAVPGADLAITYMYRAIQVANAAAIPVIFTYDCHPENHCSFKENGGTFPTHCVMGSDGGDFVDLFKELMRDGWCLTVAKGEEHDREAFSGFSGTFLDKMLKNLKVDTVIVCGLATDYCVLATVMDALNKGYKVNLLTNAIAGVDPDDSAAAIKTMLGEGAIAKTVPDIF